MSKFVDAVSKKVGVRVYVGYGWCKFDQEDKKNLRKPEVLADGFWQTLRKQFERKLIAVPNYPEKIPISCSRLRGTHGREIWSTVMKKISKADVLIFDVAAAIKPEHLKNACEGDDLTDKIKSFNENVMVEIGVALGMEKRVLLLCPQSLFDKIPSDLRGYLWSVYTLEESKNGLVRKFADNPGLTSAYSAMLRDAALEKLVSLKITTEEESDNED